MNSDSGEYTASGPATAGSIPSEKIGGTPILAGETPALPRHLPNFNGIALSLFIIVAMAISITARAGTPGFAEFDKRAKAGEHLSVVFFGASLTWGANASDPQLTSFRGLIAQRLETAYPKAHFKFWDAAIGGTGSQLGVFRFERDVLRHKPDLVFLDFSANDDIYSDNAETLASYESLVRRILLDAHAPVVQVIFPFQWNVEPKKLDGMKRREAHLAISKAYNTAVGDAIALCQEQVKSGQTTTKKLWPFDGVHPGDAGYVVFADAGWRAFQDAVKQKLVCAAPKQMLYADTYMHNARVRVSTLTLPTGWRVGTPNPVAAYFDMLMSRWLDDEVIVSGKGEVAHLKVKFNGSMVMLFGESTQKSCKYHVYIDGNLVEHVENKVTKKEFDAGFLANLVKGNSHLVQVITEGLDPSVEHTLEIEPLFTGETEQEMRLESIGVAGGKATVTEWK